MTRIEQIKEHVNTLTDNAGLVQEYAERIMVLNRDLIRDVETNCVVDIPCLAIDTRIGMMVEDIMALESAVEKGLSGALKAYKNALLGIEEGGEDAC